MPLPRNFRFLNDRLNSILISTLIVSDIQVNWDENSVIYFDEKDEEAIEGILAKIRTAQFPTWQVLSCPVDWVNQYRQEMKRRQVPYLEELNDGQIEFLLPGNCEPHDWKFASV